MSSTEREANVGRAEQQFRDAFERLKRGTPQHLPKGSSVSQNNVAKEAGVDPSALRRRRYPKLVAEIQQWIQFESDSRDRGATAQPSAASRKLERRDLRDQLKDLALQRDDALSKLVDAEAHIVRLTREVVRLEAMSPPSKVAPIRPAQAAKSALGSSIASPIDPM